jgi:hypothetical protein
MLLGIFYPVLQRWRFQQRVRDTYPPLRPAAARREEAGSVRFGRGAAFSLFLTLFFAAAIWLSLDFPGRAAFFPWAIGVPGLLMALLQLGFDLLGEVGAGSLAEDDPGLPPGVGLRRTLAIWGWIAALPVAIWLVGFSPGVFLVMFLYLKAGAHEGWRISLALSAGGFLFVLGLMDWALQMPLPAGILWSALWQ